MSERSDQMKAAAEIALKDFSKDVGNMSASQKKGAQAVVDFIRANYRTAGYKHLCRGLLYELFPKE